MSLGKGTGFWQKKGMKLPAPPDKPSPAKKLAVPVLVVFLFTSIFVGLYHNPKDDLRLYRAYAKGHVVENMTTKSVMDFAFERAFKDRCLVWIGEASNNDKSKLMLATNGFVHGQQAEGNSFAVGDVRQIPAMSSLHGVPGVGEWIGVVVTCR